jgi:hypothetical protein
MLARREIPQKWMIRIKSMKINVMILEQILTVMMTRLLLLPLLVW